MTRNQLLYKIARPFGGLQVARLMSRHHPRILMYHRVSSKKVPDAIDVETFRRQMREIRRHFNPVSLDALLEAYDADRPIPHAVVITFDDGYEDFYKNAFPILNEEGIPATLFITTGFIDGKLWLWPDQLRFCIENSLESRLNLPELKIDIRSFSDRIDAWNSLGDLCLQMDNAEKFDFINRVASALNVQIPTKAPDAYRGLTWSNVREMVAQGLVIGSHSVSHPILTSLQNDNLVAELRESRDRIMKETGLDVPAFCYPNGQPIDFNDEIKEAVKAAGYRYALAAYPGSSPLSDRWAVNRYPANQSFNLFEKSLYGFTYFGLLRKG